MRVMAGMRFGAVVAAISLCGAGAAHAQAEVTHFSANGAFASHNSSNGTTAFDLAANRNDSGSGTTTFFSFNTQTCDANFTVCTGVLGFGNIPNADFSVSTGTASLNTNLATNSGFQMSNYVQDLVNGTFTQTPVTPSGIVNISWKKIPRHSQSFTGTSTFVSGGFSTRASGSQSADSASSTGTLRGTPLPTVSSSFIGTNKSSQVTISR
jgi:hypothetical protein